MIRLLTTTVTCVAIGLVVGAGVGQEKSPRDKKDGEPGQKKQQDRGLQSFLDEYDRNNDGSIDRDELPKRMQHRFEKLDQDSNGKLSREELREHGARMQRDMQNCEAVFFWIYQAPYDPISLNDLQQAYTTLRELDANNDGKIEMKEIDKGKQQASSSHARSIMSEHDRNKDQKLSKQEATGRIRYYFDRYDANNDNQLDAQELQQALSSDAFEANATRSREQERK